MEVAVVQDDSTQLGAGLPAHDQVIVEHESEFRVSLQVTLHLYDPVDGGVDHIPIGVKEDSEFFEDVYEYLILHVLLVGDLRHGSLDGCGGDGVGGEYGGSEVAAGGLLLLDEHGLVDDELLDDLCGHHLGVAVVDKLVYYLVDQHEVLPDTLLIQDAAIIPEDLHHAVQDVHHERRRHIVFGSGHEEYAELLSIEEIDSLHIL